MEPRTIWRRRAGPQRVEGGGPFFVRQFDSLATSPFLTDGSVHS